MQSSGKKLSLSLGALAAMVATVLLLAATGVDGGSVLPSHCSGESAETLPPRFRRICAALYEIAEISNAVEQYLDDKTLRDPMPLIDSGVKRQDVDHVFLRFGRR